MADRISWLLAYSVAVWFRLDELRAIPEPWFALSLVYVAAFTYWAASAFRRFHGGAR